MCQKCVRSVSEVCPKCVRRVGGVKYWYVTRICLLTLPRLPNQPRVLPVAGHWLVGSLPTTVAIEEVGLHHHNTATTNTATTNTKFSYQSEKTEIQQPTATNNNQPTTINQHHNHQPPRPKPLHTQHTCVVFSFLDQTQLFTGSSCHHGVSGGCGETKIMRGILVPDS